MVATAGPLASTKLFLRRASLTIGYPLDPALDKSVTFNPDNSAGADVSGLDFDATVEKSLKPDAPNTCSLKIYNLYPKTRQNISGDHSLTVRLEAGYVGAVSQIYFSEVRSAWSTRERATFVTRLESSDTIARPTGVRKTKKLQPGEVNGVLNRTLGPRVPIAQAFQTIATSLGIGTGNLQDALRGGVPRGISHVNGAALVGNAARRMTDLCRSAGLEWSIQDGALQLTNIAGTLSAGGFAVLVSPSTGMLDSPSVDSQGTVSCSTLLVPGLAPGALVSIDSLFVQGGYRVEKCRYVLSTKGKDWTCHFDAKRY